MENQKGMDTSGNWYKGNLHSHTNLTDAVLTPEIDCKSYRMKGYSFLCISDHDLYTDFRSEYSTEDFIVLPGIEYSAVLYSEDGRHRYKMHHMNGILGTSVMQRNAELPPFKHLEKVKPLEFYGSWDGAEAAQQMADMMTRRGMLVTYNHPYWSRVTEEEFMDTKGLWAVEIYNYGTDVECNLGYDIIHWDRLLREGNYLCGFASDDNHNYPVCPDSFGGWIMVNADRLTHDSIIEAMLAGNYYSSSGPEIYGYGVRDNKVWIDCSPVEHVNFMIGNEICDGASVWGELHEDRLTDAEFQLKGHEDYVRIECVDRWGRTAWTNPMYDRIP